MIVNGDRQDTFGRTLSNHIVIEVFDDLARGRDLIKQLFAGTTAAFFLFQDRLAQLDAFRADVNVAGPFDQWADIAVALSTERTEGILLVRRAAASGTVVILDGHKRLLVCGSADKIVQVTTYRYVSSHPEILPTSASNGSAHSFSISFASLLGRR